MSSGREGKDSSCFTLSLSFLLPSLSAYCSRHPSEHEWILRQNREAECPYGGHRMIDVTFCCIHVYKQLPHSFAMIPLLRRSRQQPSLYGTRTATLNGLDFRLASCMNFPASAPIPIPTPTPTLSRVFIPISFPSDTISGDRIVNSTKVVFLSSILLCPLRYFTFPSSLHSLHQSKSKWKPCEQLQVDMNFYQP